MKVNIQSADGYTGARQTLLTETVAAIERVMTLKKFEEEILRAQFSFKKNWFRLYQSYTNKEVFQLIIQAREEQGNIAPGQMDLYLKVLEEDGGNVFGYGNPGDPIIYTYKSFIDDPETTPADFANQLVHEWCHKIGFEHARNIYLDPDWQNSVPYFVGNLVQRLIETK